MPICLIPLFLVLSDKAGFNFAHLVAEFGGVFVAFFGNGKVDGFFEFIKPPLDAAGTGWWWNRGRGGRFGFVGKGKRLGGVCFRSCRGGSNPAGRFADMAGAFVHGAQHAFQVIGEDPVAFRAAHAPDLFEVGAGEATGGTGEQVFILRLGFWFFLSCAKQKVRKLEAGGVGDALLFGAFVTKIHLGHFPINDLGEKDRGFVVAHVALHLEGVLNFEF